MQKKLLHLRLLCIQRQTVSEGKGNANEAEKEAGEKKRRVEWLAQHSWICVHGKVTMIRYFDIFTGVRIQVAKEDGKKAEILKYMKH